MNVGSKMQFVINVIELAILSQHVRIRTLTGIQNNLLGRKLVTLLTHILIMIIVIMTAGLTHFMITLFLVYLYLKCPSVKILSY